MVKLYGKILKNLGYLSSDDLVAENASDSIGKYVDHSASNTNDIFR